MPVTVTVGARTIPTITETLVKPLVTTKPGLVELSGLGQNDEPLIAPSVPKKSSTLGTWFKTNPVGQALTAGVSAIIGATANNYASTIGSAPIPAGTIAPPAITPAKALPWGIIATLAALGIGGAVYLSRR